MTKASLFVRNFIGCILALLVCACVGTLITEPAMTNDLMLFIVFTMCMASGLVLLMFQHK
jgi:ABC-type Mn2+/Zn2+ transport system permease subunit